MPSNASPHFRVLDTSEIWATLARNHVGRIAYSFHDHVDVEPVHYVYSDGWIYGRTSRGEKLVALEHHHWVAFEVDEVRGPFDWRSVVIHGGFYELSPEHDTWEHALQLLRTLVPETLTKGDPAPFRTVLFRIAVQESTGREAVPHQDESNPSRRASVT